MTSAKYIAAALLTSAISMSANADETHKYRYDAKGRLIKVERSGSINDDVDTVYTHDKADNRTRVEVTGVTTGPPPPANQPPTPVTDLLVAPRCAFRQSNVITNDEDPENDVLSLDMSVPLTGPPDDSDGSSFTSFSSTLNRLDVNTPNVTERKFYTVYYTVKDSADNTAIGTLTIDVRAFGPTC